MTEALARALVQRQIGDADAVDALFVTSAVLPKGQRRGNPRIDYAGSAVLVAAVTCIVLFTTWGGTEHPWGSPVMLGLIGASVVLLAVLGVVIWKIAGLGRTVDPTSPNGTPEPRTLFVSS